MELNCKKGIHEGFSLHPILGLDQATIRLQNSVYVEQGMIVGTYILVLKEDSTNLSLLLCWWWKVEHLEINSAFDCEQDWGKMLILQLLGMGRAMVRFRIPYSSLSSPCQAKPNEA